MMINQSQISPTEYISTNKLIHKFIDPRKRILALDCNLIQLSVINRQHHATIFLLNQQHRHSPRRLTRSRDVNMAGRGGAEDISPIFVPITKFIPCPRPWSLSRGSFYPHPCSPRILHLSIKILFLKIYIYIYIL